MSKKKYELDKSIDLNIVFNSSKKKDDIDDINFDLLLDPHKKYSKQLNESKQKSNHSVIDLNVLNTQKSRKLSSEEKEKRSEYKKIWYQKNKEKVKKYNKSYKGDHKDELKVKDKIYYENKKRAGDK